MDAVAESLQSARGWGAGSVVRHWPSQHLMARAGSHFPLKVVLVAHRRRWSLII